VYWYISSVIKSLIPVVMTIYCGLYSFASELLSPNLMSWTLKWMGNLCYAIDSELLPATSFRFSLSEFWCPVCYDTACMSPGRNSFSKFFFHNFQVLEIYIGSQEVLQFIDLYGRLSPVLRLKQLKNKSLHIIHDISRPEQISYTKFNYLYLL
jgi:hypothetical protein